MSTPRRVLAAAIATYLGLRDEADSRGYRFDAARTDLPDDGARGPLLTVATGRLARERDNLAAELADRSPGHPVTPATVPPRPLFPVEPGEVAPWERG